MISVIMPVHNRQALFLSSLRSIELQTNQDLEIIIIDDGSDPAIDIPKHSKSLNIMLIRQENKGAPAARNRGFRESSGEFVIFWDADIIAKPEMLEKMLKALENNNDASFVYSDFKFGWKKMKCEKFDVERLKKNNYITTTSLIRRAAFPGFDENLKRFQDWDLWLTMSEAGSTGIWVPECLFKILPHELGMSAWLPGFAYRVPFRNLPWINTRVKKYENAKQVVLMKHNLGRR